MEISKSPKMMGSLVMSAISVVAFIGSSTICRGWAPLAKHKVLKVELCTQVCSKLRSGLMLGSAAGLCSHAENTSRG